MPGSSAKYRRNRMHKRVLRNLHISIDIYKNCRRHGLTRFVVSIGLYIVVNAVWCRWKMCVVASKLTVVNRIGTLYTRPNTTLVQLWSIAFCCVALSRVGVVVVFFSYNTLSLCGVDSCLGMFNEYRRTTHCCQFRIKIPLDSNDRDGFFTGLKNS